MSGCRVHVPVYECQRVHTKRCMQVYICIGYISSKEGHTLFIPCLGYSDLGTGFAHVGISRSDLLSSANTAIR